MFTIFVVILLFKFLIGKICRVHIWAVQYAKSVLKSENTFYYQNLVEVWGVFSFDIYSDIIIVSASVQ